MYLNMVNFSQITNVSFKFETGNPALLKEGPLIEEKKPFNLEINFQLQTQEENLTIEKCKRIFEHLFSIKSVTLYERILSEENELKKKFTEQLSTTLVLTSNRRSITCLFLNIEFPLEIQKNRKVYCFQFNGINLLPPIIVLNKYYSEIMTGARSMNNPFSTYRNILDFTKGVTWLEQRLEAKISLLKQKEKIDQIQETHSWHIKDVSDPMITALNEAFGDITSKDPFDGDLPNILQLNAAASINYDY